MLTNKIARKDEKNSNGDISFYDVDAQRYIYVEHTESGRVTKLGLMLRGRPFAEFEANRTIYIEQLADTYINDETGEQFKAIGLDWLDYMSECFTEVC